MTFDPREWPRTFEESHLERVITCPNCHKKELKPKKEDFLFGAPFAADDDERAGLPPFPYRFSARLTCGRCRETVVVCGKAIEHLETDANGDEIGWTNITPQFIEPAPRLFAIPRDAPESVARTLRQAFSLYWCDLDACIARLRTAVELFLTSEGLQAETSNAKPIPLSARLKEYESAQPLLAKKLEAVKWLGDAGTHRLGVNVKSVNDGLQIISTALEDRYERLKIEQLAEEIIRKKGPTSGT